MKKILILSFFLLINLSSKSVSVENELAYINIKNLKKLKSDEIFKVVSGVKLRSLYETDMIPNGSKHIYVDETFFNDGKYSAFIESKYSRIVNEIMGTRDFDGDWTMNGEWKTKQNKLCTKNTIISVSVNKQTLVDYEIENARYDCARVYENNQDGKKIYYLVHFDLYYVKNVVFQKIIQFKSLEEIKKEKEERLAKKKKEEEERLAKKKKEEEERLAKKKKEEEEVISKGLIKDSKNLIKDLEKYEFFHWDDNIKILKLNIEALELDLINKDKYKKLESNYKDLESLTKNEILDIEIELKKIEEEERLAKKKKKEEEAKRKTELAKAKELERIKRFKNNFGYKDIKFGMMNQDILKLGVCRKNWGENYTCYENDHWVFSFTYGYGKELIQMHINLGPYTTDYQQRILLKLNDKYTFNYDYCGQERIVKDYFVCSGRQMELFNEGKLDKLPSVFKHGAVVLYIERSWDNTAITLNLEYNDAETANRVYEELKPKVLSTDDF